MATGAILGQRGVMNVNGNYPDGAGGLTLSAEDVGAATLEYVNSKFLGKDTSYIVRPDTPGQLGAYGQVWSRLGNTAGAYKGDNYYVGVDSVGKIWSGYQLNDASDITWKDQSAGEDVIVAQGTSGGWDYRKWASGVAECWTYYDVSGNINTAWGSLFSGCHKYSEQYPFTFKSVPQEFMCASAPSYSVIPFVAQRNTTVRSGEYEVARPTAITNENVRYNMYIIGRWK